MAAFRRQDPSLDDRDYRHHVQAPKRKRRWRRRLFLLLMLPVVLVAAAPTLVTKTPLLGMLLERAIPAERGSLQIARATLGWLTPLQVEGIELRDAKGATLLTLERAQGDRPLWQLVSQRGQLGTLRLRRPIVYARPRRDGSDWEDYLATWQSDSSATGESTALAVQVVVEEGAIHVEDSTTTRRWSLEQVAVQADIDTDAEQPVAVKLASTVASQRQPGSLSVEVAVDPTYQAGNAKLDTQQLPLDLVQVCCERFLPQAAFDGRLTSQLKVTWNLAESNPSVSVAGETTIDQLFASIPGLPDDEVSLARLVVPCHIEWDGTQLAIHQATLDCDAGHLEASGTLSLATLTTGNWGLLAEEEFHLVGQLDAARLATLLPKTLHLREDTSITTGRLAFGIDSQRPQGQQQWQARLEATDLALERAGQAFAWREPIQLELRAHRQDAGLQIDQLVCQSNFLQAQAQGTPEQLTAQARLDLSRAAEELGQVVDLAGWRIEGQADAQLTWQRVPQDGAFKAATSIELQAFHLAAPNQSAWREAKLRVEAQGAGQLDETGLQAVQQAQVNVTSGEDRLTAQLTAAVSDQQPTTTWPVAIELQGRIARWRARLRPWLAANDLDLDGHCTLSARLACGETELQIADADLRVRDMVFRPTAGVRIAEPAVNLQGQANWNWEQQRLTIPDCTLASNTLSARAERMTADLNPGGKLEGTISFNGALDRIEHWFTQLGPQPTWLCEGQLAGRVDLAHQSQQTTAHIELTGNNLRLRQRTRGPRGEERVQTHLREPSLQSTIVAVHNHAQDQLRLQEARLVGQALELNAQGAIGQLSTKQDLQLSGTVRYDLKKLMPWITPYVGRQIIITGQDTAQFTIAGPLGASAGESAEIPHWSKRLQIDLAAGWQTAEVYGLQVGPGRVVSRVAQGRVVVEPLNVPVSQGQLSLSSQAQLDPAPAMLYAPAGPLLTQVRLAPENCNVLLKYVAPALADATRCDGRFSVDLDGAQIPLAQPEKTDMAGRLTIHQGQVYPGPLAEQFVLLAKQIEALVHRRPLPSGADAANTSLLEIGEQTIQFRVVQGRIYHGQTIVRSGRVTIYTRGSVGFDQTLDIEAQIPIQDAWLGNNPLVASLRGMTLRVPIRGTFNKPQMDSRALAQISSQMLQGAAQKAISNEVHRQLNRLLGAPR